MQDMMKRFNIIALALAVAIGAAGTADARTRATDVKEIVKKIKATYNSTKTAEVKFEQVNDAGTSVGTLVYAPGDRFRLEFQMQTMVSDGKKVWVYNQMRKQLVITKPSQGQGKLTPSEILTSFPGDYTTTLVGEEKVNNRAVWVIRCTPGTGKKVGDVEKATLYVDKSTFRFQQIEVESPSVGTMKIRIMSAKYGVKVPDSRFTFTAPKEARIIDLTR